MLIYNFVVRCYGLAISIASLRKHKAKLWVSGRKNWQNKLQSDITKLNNSKRAWFHCASLGEFEQGKPLIERFRKEYPDYNIILTFFSPSGYEVSKDYKYADLIYYLPLDTPNNSRKFIELTNPNIVFFIKYEFWLNYMSELRRRSIRTFLISAVFKPHHPFFRWYGNIFRESLKVFEHMFLQDIDSLERVKNIGYGNISVCGDTRYDRVLEIKERAEKIESIEAFKGDSKLIIAGSTWPKDAESILKAFKIVGTGDVKLIIAPHEIDSSSLEDLVQTLEKSELSYCLWTKSIDNNKKVLVLDTIGMLSKSYKYADITYIGGGYNEGIHNVLEPAVFCSPVIVYGNSFRRFVEAEALFNKKALFNFEKDEELVNILNNLIENQTRTNEIRQILDQHFKSIKSATSIILGEIKNV
ncbi:MAG: 3-deoxy-D-manno-octulosonic acid transferase [Bacteroidia bacterium]